MILLSFTVRNHKSFRDEVTIDFVRPSLHTLTPKNGRTWEESVFPVLGVFGGNATGKSTILDALNYAFTAVEHSAAGWLAHKHMPRAPFALSRSAREGTSKYELDFVLDGRRYVYGFEVGPERVEREWLRDLPSTRWRTLFSRNADRKVHSHASVRAVSEVSERELVLSRALLLGHEQLAPIARGLVDSFDIVAVSDEHRASRLRSLADSLAEGVLTFDDVVELLRVADIGVKDVTVAEDEVPRHFQAAVRAFQHVMEHPEENTEGAISIELDDDESDAVVRNLQFTHNSSDDESPEFYIQEESDGTLAWLALAVPAIERLRDGGIYCVDEVDSSLHPYLLDLLLEAFADPTINTKGAQLLFTSHETYVLSPLSKTELEPEQVWFTDKSNDGATELFCLDDFPRHKDANVAKRYLEGRYGGVPRLMPSVFAALVRSKDD